MYAMRLPKSLCDKVLQYLCAKSEIARALLDCDGGRVTLKMILGLKCDTPKRLKNAIRLLACLPQFETEKPMYSKCILNKTWPYESIAHLSISQLMYLHEIADYLCMPANIVNRLKQVIDNSTNVTGYKFNDESDISLEYSEPTETSDYVVWYVFNERNGNYLGPISPD